MSSLKTSSLAIYHKLGDSKACVRSHVVSLHVPSPHAACPNYHTELDSIYTYGSGSAHSVADDQQKENRELETAKQSNM